mgnify:CR=1 FL=1
MGGASYVATHQRRTVELAQPRSALAFFNDGMLHIWGGLDHILFLVALLLPLTLRSRGKLQYGQILKIVTAFTVAHSVTLILAVLGWFNPPSRIVEIVIAASVLVAALNNLRPMWDERAWIVACGFGLVHGFGFAGPLVDAGLGARDLVPMLLAFNLGVEAGQLVIVLAALPLLWLISQTEIPRLRTLQAGSAAIGLMAMIWLVERL